MASPLPLSMPREGKSMSSVFGVKSKNGCHKSNVPSDEKEVKKSIILQPNDLSSIQGQNPRSLDIPQPSLTNHIENNRESPVLSPVHSAFKPHKSSPNLNNTLGHPNSGHTTIQSSLHGSNGLPLKKLNLQKVDKGSFNKHSSSAKFSHQNRRRPLYQRSNTEPESFEEATLSSMNPSLTSLSSNGNLINGTSSGYISSKADINASCPIAQVGQLFGGSSPTKNSSGSHTNVVPIGCVYLRPEQNIPDVFFASRKATTFKPIEDIPKIEHSNNDSRLVKDLKNAKDKSKKSIDVERNCISDNDVQPTSDQDISISRDDIVVTMRSVNV